MTIIEYVKKMKGICPEMGASSLELRNLAIKEIQESLIKNKEAIYIENKKDVENAIAQNIPQPVIKRLIFDDKKMQSILNGLDDLMKLKDPLNQTLLKRQLDKGLELYKQTCPIGVIGVIFEARPDAMIQIASLCVKSGNCVVLKGGSETRLTNKIIFSLIHDAVRKIGLPEYCMYQVEERTEIKELLICDKYVDLIIPRGSNAFVRYIMENTKIPVIGHAEGLCSIYVDKIFDLNKAVEIIIDSKIQYAAVCNSVENLFIHKDSIPKLLPKLNLRLKEENIKIKRTQELSNYLDGELANEQDFSTEYLDYIISIKSVQNIEEAINLINTKGSHHTDCIITEDSISANKFMNLVDSANVFLNCSTRFSDGYRYGFGAEVGVSTGKIHARGPVGLEGMVTYKYKLFGTGQLVKNYVDGSNFKFMDLM